LPEDGPLLLQSCTHCGSVQYPPGLICRGCQVPGTLGEIPCSMKGVLHSFTRIDEAIMGTADRAAVIGLVETPDAVRLLVPIGRGTNQLHVGSPVELRIVDGVLEGWCEGA
jgi:uncharacterized OB-fold protein